MSNVPKLRFSEFSGEWEEKKLSDITKINQGLQIPISDRFTEQVENSFFYITNEFLKKDSQKKYFIKNPSLSVLCDENDILMTRTGNTGQVVTNVNGAFHNNFFKIKYDDCISKNYLVYFLRSTKVQNKILSLAGTSTIPDLNHGDFYKIKIALPSKKEQEKIASFLTSIDSKIEQLTKKESLLQEYKKGVMQKIFNQEIRFKADDGSEFCHWEEKNLNELMYEPKERNYEKKYTKNDVLSVSGLHGIVNQIEFQGRSFAGASVYNYHIVKVQDIVYTKSPLKANPYGIIKTNKYKDGIVSTLYAVYRPKECLFSEYINYYFEIDDNVNKYLRPLVHKGAKNDMKINNQHVLSGSISIPQKAEQIKIVNFLSSIDKKIKLANIELKKTKEFKKALLQKMFV